MGHCSDFGYIVVIFVMPANPQNEAEQQKSVMIPTLWAIAQDLVMYYGP
jgi:hypothetical protein